MRALILTCNTGGGHNSCAKAIQQVFYEHELVCDIADSLEFASSRLSHFMSWGHTTMYRHVPGLFRWGYGFAEKHPGVIEEDTAVYKLLSSGANQLYDRILQGNYDTVICTHVFSGVLLAQMLREHSVALKTAFVATDYTCSPGTAVSHLDWYFIPHETLASEYESQGVPKERIVASGIPVSRSFYNKQAKGTAKEAVGISPTHTHLLMMCGSMGCGPLEELTKLLQIQMDAAMELTIVCGTNEKLQHRLEKLAEGDSRIHVHGFVSNMSELMDSADLYLTKPGGLSTTEAAAKRLPMVLIDAVAGCEAHNMDFFIKCGGAVTAERNEELASLCVSLLSQPDILAAMSSSLALFAENIAADRIFDTIQGAYYGGHICTV